MITIKKKTIKTTCWVCKGRGCKTCHYSGKWNETIYLHTITDKQGNKICIDGDTVK